MKAIGVHHGRLWTKFPSQGLQTYGSPASLVLASIHSQILLPPSNHAPPVRRPWDSEESGIVPLQAMVPHVPVTSKHRIVLDHHTIHLYVLYQQHIVLISVGHKLMRTRTHRPRCILFSFTSIRTPHYFPSHAQSFCAHSDFNALSRERNIPNKPLQPDIIVPNTSQRHTRGQPTALCNECSAQLCVHLIQKFLQVIFQQLLLQRVLPSAAIFAETFAALFCVAKDVISQNQFPPFPQLLHTKTSES